MASQRGWKRRDVNSPWVEVNEDSHWDDDCIMDADPQIGAALPEFKCIQGSCAGTCNPVTRTVEVDADGNPLYVIQLCECTAG